MNACEICSSVPEDILVLSCFHEICMECASKTLKTRNVIQCSSCEAITYLQKDIIQEIHKSIQIADTFLTQEDYSLTKEVEKKIKTEISPKKQQRQNMACKRHPESQLSYVCHTCQTQCICSECAITGSHKMHDVQNLNNAFKLVFENVKAQISQIQQCQEQIRNLNEGLIQQNGVVESTFKKLAIHKQQQFQKIKHFIDQEEQKVENSYKDLKSKQIKEIEFLQKESTQAQKQMQELQQNSEYILALSKQNTSENKVAILNFYSENHRKIQNSLKQVKMKINKIQDNQNLCDEYNLLLSKQLTENLQAFPNTIQNLYDKVNPNQPV